MTHSSPEVQLQNEITMKLVRDTNEQSYGIIALVAAATMHHHACPVLRSARIGDEIWNTRKKESFVEN